MDARARELEALYETRYVSFRNALATVTGSRGSVMRFRRRSPAPSPGVERHRDDGCLAAWVWKIAVRVALENRRRLEARPLEDPPQPELLAPERDPELAAALRRLPPRRRLIVFLRYFGDFSYAEIAQACDVSEGTVAAALAQARAELRAALELEGALR
jgi:RNA polymerase sigma factor (sigma-70 family)